MISGKETPLKKAPARKRPGVAHPTTNSQGAAESGAVTDFQGHTKELLAVKFANIMATMAQKSVEGSLSHTKYLFEISGVREELQRQVQNNGEPTLAELLMAEVKRHRDEAALTKAETIEASGKTESQGCGQACIHCGAKGQ